MPSQRRVKVLMIAVVVIIFLSFYYSVRVIESVALGLYPVSHHSNLVS